MNALYFSLVSALPALKLFEAPAIRTEEFMADCKRRLPAKEFAYLQALNLIPAFDPDDFHDLSALKKEIREAVQTLSETRSCMELSRNAYLGIRPAIFPVDSLAQRYTAWEDSLRNELSRIRAAKLGGDFAAPPAWKSVHDSEAARTALLVYGAANPLEREQQLDAARWKKLDELEARNPMKFCFDTLCAFRLRLLIVEKWKARDSQKALDGLNAVANTVTGSLDPDGQKQPE